jgi:hypothetical protein
MRTGMEAQQLEDGLAAGQALKAEGLVEGVRLKWRFMRCVNTRPDP